jgi:hypothetical protein
MRYVDKIVSEPSTNLNPPKLVNPNWAELIVSLLKIIAVALVWTVIAVVLIVPVGLIFGLGALGGITGLATFATKFSLSRLGVAIGGFVIIAVISLFAIMSEVNLLKKGKNMMAAFTFNELLSNIKKIGGVRYILYTVSFLILWALTIFVSMQIGNFTDLSILVVSLMGILTLFVGHSLLKQ